MKALSLLQPWASLVMMGAKTIETRSWATAYRGQLLIHASLGRRAGAIVKQPPFSLLIPDFNTLPFGAILGTVVLDGVVRIGDTQFSDNVLASLSLEERAFGDYTPGRFAWLLSTPIPLQEPIPMKGSLGLWEYHL